MHLDPPMLEISDTWSYQDINHVLTDHDTNQHMYRVIPMISSPPTAATSATDIVVNTYSSGSYQTTREDVLTRLNSYLPLLRWVCGWMSYSSPSLSTSHTRYDRSILQKTKWLLYPPTNLPTTVYSWAYLPLRDCGKCFLFLPMSYPPWWESR